MNPAATNGGAAVGGVIPHLEFAIEGAEAARDSATPLVRLALRVGCAEQREIQSIMLDAQVRIAPRRRSYAEAEEERLTDLFGPLPQWGSSMQSLLWTNASVHVGHLEGSATTGLPLPCTYDFEVSAARYLAALDDGSIPLEVLFSGTVFYAGAEGRPQAARIPLDREATFELPVRVWREAMDRHFPGSAWLRLSRASFERLYAYRSRHVLPSWDAVVESLLEAEEERA